MSEMKALNLRSTHLRLRPDSAIEKLPVDDSFWPRLINGEMGDFHHEYLVVSNSFDSDWPSWEKHPNGDEIVCLLTGRVVLTLEMEGGNRQVELKEMGDYAFVPKGTWHTASTQGPAVMLFITAGEGTEIRPR